MCHGLTNGVTFIESAIESIEGGIRKEIQLHSVVRDFILRLNNSQRDQQLVIRLGKLSSPIIQLLHLVYKVTNSRMQVKRIESYVSCGITVEMTLRVFGSVRR